MRGWGRGERRQSDVSACSRARKNRNTLGTSKFIFLVYVLLVNLLSVGAEVLANVNAAAPVLVLACICVCVVVAILLCRWSEGPLLCPLYVSSTSAA